MSLRATTLLTAASAVAALLALSLWSIRRVNLAPQALGGCSALAMTASATGTATGTARGVGSGGTAAAAGGRPRGKPPKRTTRRAFLRNSWLGTMALGLGAFGGASIMYMWPSLTGGFGAQVEVEEEGVILEEIRANNAPYELPTGRTYLVEYDPALDPDGQYADLTKGASVMALYWKCVHLGCRVPWCESSQWFECPCHGSRYNRWGEWQGGPAPRGLDRFALEIRDGVVVVDTANVVTGPPRTAAMLDQPPEGPSCL